MDDLSTKHTYSGDVANVETRHEESDVNVRALLWFVAIFIAFAAVTHVALWLMFKFFVQLERGESNADRWQLEQRIKHAENQLAVAGRG